MSSLDKSKCYQTGKRQGNFAIIKKQDLKGVTRDYEVYFNIDVKNGILYLFVESAYVRDDQNKHIPFKNGKTSIGFYTLLYNRLKGLPIKSAPRR